jgi:hypothetical protein
VIYAEIVDYICLLEQQISGSPSSSPPLEKQMDQMSLSHQVTGPPGISSHSHGAPPQFTGPPGINYPSQVTPRRSDSTSPLTHQQPPGLPPSQPDRAERAMPPPSYSMEQPLTTPPQQSERSPPPPPSQEEVLDVTISTLKPYQVYYLERFCYEDTIRAVQSVLPTATLQFLSMSSPPSLQITMRASSRQEMDVMVENLTTHMKTALRPLLASISKPIKRPSPLGATKGMIDTDPLLLRLQERSKILCLCTEDVGALPSINLVARSTDPYTWELLDSYITKTIGATVNHWPQNEENCTREKFAFVCSNAAFYREQLLRLGVGIEFLNDQWKCQLSGHPSDVQHGLSLLASVVCREVEVAPNNDALLHAVLTTLSLLERNNQAGGAPPGMFSPVNPQQLVG